MSNAVVIGWRDLHDRAEVRRRRDGSLLGYVRLAEGRWFAEDVRQAPLEGTFRTRCQAVDAVLTGVNPYA